MGCVSGYKNLSLTVHTSFQESGGRERTPHRNTVYRSGTDPRDVPMPPFAGTAGSGHGLVPKPEHGSRPAVPGCDLRAHPPFSISRTGRPAHRRSGPPGGHRQRLKPADLRKRPPAPAGGAIPIGLPLPVVIATSSGRTLAAPGRRTSPTTVPSTRATSRNRHRPAPTVSGDDRAAQARLSGRRAPHPIPIAPGCQAGLFPGDRARRGRCVLAGAVDPPARSASSIS